MRTKKLFTVVFVVMLLLAMFVLPVSAAPLTQETANPPTAPTAEMIAGIAGVVISLAFSYIPGLNVKFAALLPEEKRLVMALLILIVSIGMVFLSCYGVIAIGFSCTQDGFIRMAWVVIAALVANQSTYAITPQPASVRVASANASARSMARLYTEPNDTP